MNVSLFPRKWRHNTYSIFMTSWWKYLLFELSSLWYTYCFQRKTFNVFTYGLSWPAFHVKKCLNHYFLCKRRRRFLFFSDVREGSSWWPRWPAHWNRTEIFIQNIRFLVYHWLQEKYRIVAKIGLTYCEKKCLSDRE